MRQGEDDFDAFSAEDVDLAGAVFALVGADGEEALDGVVGDLRNLRIDPEVFDLHQRISLALQSFGKAGRALGMSGTRGTPTWSSRNKSGPKPVDRSLWTPACLPRKRCAMVVSLSFVVAQREKQRADDSQGLAVLRLHASCLQPCKDPDDVRAPTRCTVHYLGNILIY